MKVGLIIGTDQRLLREGLEALLARQPELRLLGVAQDGHALVSLVAESQPAVVLLTAHIPRLNAVDATLRMTRHDPRVRVILLDAERDRHFVVRGLEAGVAGFLHRESGSAELLRAIDTVLGNAPYLSPPISGVLIEEVLRSSPPAPESAFSVLTAREREVLQLIAEGQTTKEAAARLGVSGKTVEWHRTQVMRKLDLHSVAALTRYAVREGLVPLSD